MDDLTPGGSGGAAPEPSQGADLRLAQQALRNDWPLLPEVKRELLESLVAIATTSTRERNKIGASKALALFARLTLGQQALDLARQKVEGGGEFNLSELVAEAERIVETHRPALPPATTQPK